MNTNTTTTTNKTTIAKRFECMALRLNRDECGYATGDYRPLLNLIRRESVYRRFPLGADSLDPTIEYFYVDGSKLRVDNPAQECFPLRISETFII